MSVPRSAQYQGWWKNEDDNTFDLYVGLGGASSPVKIAAVSESTYNLITGITLNVNSGATLDASAGTLTLAAGQVAAASITDDSLTGDQVANVAADNTEGGIPLIYRFTLAAQAVTADVTISVVDKIRVLDFWAINTAGAGVASDTIQLQSSGGNITSTISWSGADLLLSRAIDIDDAQHEIGAGLLLQVEMVNAATTDATGAGVAYVLATKIS